MNDYFFFLWYGVGQITFDEVFHVKHDVYYLDDLQITSEQYKKLKIYQDAVMLWEKKTDLIGSHDKDNFFERHILNSLYFLRLLNDADLLIHDIGSGAGLPGLICRICDSNMQRHYVLFEKKYQKRSFLKNMIIHFNLKNITVCEKYPDVSRETSDVLTSRALLSLQDLKKYQLNFKKFVLFKGRNYLDEIKFLNNIDKQDKIKVYKALQDDSYLLVGDSNECFT
ncbi:MAG: 16S rRNA (guanine527-N7)-methyltransferase [Alphaproteobacteria bacterium]